MQDAAKQKLATEVVVLELRVKELEEENERLARERREIDAAFLRYRTARPLTTKASPPQGRRG